MNDIWRMESHMESVVKAYKTLTKIPSIVGGRLNKKGNRVTSRWSIRNLDKGKSTNYLIDYILDDNLGVSQSQFGIDITHELLTAVSPKENFKAVIREEKDEKDAAKKKFFLEVWSSASLIHSIDLTALDIHGDVYTDSEFGSLSWSPDESKIVYVAEKKVKKSEPFIKRKPAEAKNDDPDKKPVPGREHVYRNDWGEQLTGKIESVVVVCTLPDETFTVFDTVVPGNPGQVRFSPSGDYIVGVRWEAKMIGRLGLIYCTNRPSFVFCFSLSGKCKSVSGAGKAVRSPRFAPNGDLVWLQREANGPHHACHQLVRVASDDIKNLLDSEEDRLDDDKVSVIIDIVQTEQEISNGVFYGVYCQSLPAACFSADSKRLIFSTQQQTEIRSYVVDFESRSIVDISNNKKRPGSTTVLSVQADVILATFSNMTTPGQLFVARLPGADKEVEMEWVRVSAANEAPSGVANSKLEYMTLKQDTGDSVSSFTAIYFGPDEGKVYPLVVWPHGGPHSAFSNSYSLEAAFFNMIGFACLMINYRGSSGAGDSSIFHLPGRIGTSDVDDCKLATQKALGQFPVDEKRLLLYGGSHGGFLVCHLGGVYPEMYSAMVARNPVVDLASMANTSDIADWCAVEAGWPFTEEGPLEEDKLLALRRVSPIVHAHKVVIPTALMLGSKDKRVPHYQGLEYARRLKANGVKVAVHMYEDNHALGSLPVEMDNLLNAADWLVSHAKP